MVSSEVWQRLSNNIPVLYADIMLDALVTNYAFNYGSIIGWGPTRTSRSPVSSPTVMEK